MSNWINPKTDDLFLATLKLKNINEARRFFRDLLTPQEIIEFSRRWQAAQMLYAGEKYTKVEKATSLSSRTVARVAKWLWNGKDGYKLILKRMGKKHHTSSHTRKRLR
ncbi:hypothetical protein KKC88_03515 [Patescibacteria group bacterium]|nr:hypothetical protein [Patescibacteria group bacterium]MBU1673559.1 hypothetical protein [Patescibacteria group bacterium]MBU1963637.1 hypothetical protein [Patescibacteria group bacterium]